MNIKKQLSCLVQKVNFFLYILYVIFINKKTPVSPRKDGGFKSMIMSGKLIRYHQSSCHFLVINGYHNQINTRLQLSSIEVYIVCVVD
jgi:hypothetical protein